MTAEVVNLRLARKAKARAEHAADGSANRALHGRSKEQRETARREAETAVRRHEGHRLEGFGLDHGLDDNGGHDGDAA